MPQYPHLRDSVQRGDTRGEGGAKASLHAVCFFLTATGAVLSVLCVGEECICHVSRLALVETQNYQMRLKLPKNLQISYEMLPQKNGGGTKPPPRTA